MRETTELSQRLYNLADMIKPCNRVADVGCDHGFVSIWLVEHDRTVTCLATDVNDGPLRSAREHIAQHGLSEKIEVRKSDGLKNIKPGEVDAILIAGMGGRLMERILTEGEKVVEQVSYMVLQPQSCIYEFRRFLSEHGFCVEDERMVHEDGKFYPMMRVVVGESRYTEDELTYGPVLLARQDPVLKEYLLFERGVQDQIEKSLKNASECRLDRYRELQEKRSQIERVLRRTYGL